MDEHEIFPELITGQHPNGEPFFAEAYGLNSLLSSWIKLSGVPDEKREKLQQNMTVVFVGILTNRTDIIPKTTLDILNDTLHLMIKHSGGTPKGRMEYGENNSCLMYVHSEGTAQTEEVLEQIRKLHREGNAKLREQVETALEQLPIPPEEHGAIFEQAQNLLDKCRTVKSGTGLDVETYFQNKLMGILGIDIQGQLDRDVEKLYGQIEDYLESMSPASPPDTDEPEQGPFPA